MWLLGMVSANNYSFWCVKHFFPQKKIIHARENVARRIKWTPNHFHCISISSLLEMFSNNRRVLTMDGIWVCWCGMKSQKELTSKNNFKRIELVCSRMSDTFGFIEPLFSILVIVKITSLGERVKRTTFQCHRRWIIEVSLNPPGSGAQIPSKGLRFIDPGASNLILSCRSISFRFYHAKQLILCGFCCYSIRNDWSNRWQFCLPLGEIPCTDAEDFSRIIHVLETAD